MQQLIKYYETIGYRYDIRKITKSAVIIEFLKYINKFIVKDNNIEEFVNKCKIINDSIFVPTYSREEIDMNIISDITTESDTLVLL